MDTVMHAECESSHAPCPLDEGEVTRRRRRDFIGTSLYRCKKRSRTSVCRRSKSGAVPTEAQNAASEDEQPALKRESKPKGGVAKKRRSKAPLVVRGFSREFNILSDNAQTPEALLSIIGNEDLPNRYVAQQLAQYLWEQEVGLVERCLDVFPRESILRWAKATLSIEVSGGTMINNQTRRRTPGGIFFKLVQREATKEELMKTIGVPGYRQRRNKVYGLLWPKKHRGPAIDVRECPQPANFFERRIEEGGAYENPFAQSLQREDHGVLL